MRGENSEAAACLRPSERSERVKRLVSEHSSYSR